MSLTDILPTDVSKLLITLL